MYVCAALRGRPDHLYPRLLNLCRTYRIKVGGRRQPTVHIHQATGAPIGFGDDVEADRSARECSSSVPSCSRASPRDAASVRRCCNYVWCVCVGF